MNVFEQGSGEDITDEIARMLEKDTGQKIFTMRVEPSEDDDLSLNTIVVMENKSVMKGIISVQRIEGKLACRMQLNYI